MSRFELYFHVVWATKRRRPFLTPEREAEVYPIILALTREAGYVVLELNGIEDHVHLILQTGPQFDLSRLMKKLKGATSGHLNDMTNHEQHFRWQEGYYAATISPSHLAKLRAYVQNQKEHHRTGDLHPYWEETGE